MKLNFIPTQLPLVYYKENKCGNALEILSGLDLTKKDMLLGIQLLSGAIIAKTETEDVCFSSGGYLPATTWKHAQRFAERHTLNGKEGRLPDRLKSFKYSDEEINKFRATLQTLKANGISALGDYEGYIWCALPSDFSPDYEYAPVVHLRGSLPLTEISWWDKRYSSKFIFAIDF